MPEDKFDAILIDPKDNVAVAIRDLQQGWKARVKGESFEAEVLLCRDIAFGHKFALSPIREGDKIIKYGEIIGKALTDIAGGDHAHDHNIVGLRGKKGEKEKEEQL